MNLNRLFVIFIVTMSMTSQGIASTVDQELSQLFFETKKQLNDVLTTSQLIAKRERLNRLISEPEADVRLVSLGRTLDLSLRRKLNQVMPQDYIDLQKQMVTSYTLPINELHEDFVQYVRDTNYGTPFLLELNELSQQSNLKVYLSTARGLRDAAEVALMAQDTTVTRLLLRRSLELSEESEDSPYYKASSTANLLLTLYMNNSRSKSFNLVLGPLTQDFFCDVKIMVEKCPTSMLTLDLLWDLLLLLDNNQMDIIQNQWVNGLLEWGQDYSLVMGPLNVCLQQQFFMLKLKRDDVSLNDDVALTSMSSNLLALCKVSNELDLPDDSKPLWLAEGSDLFFNGGIKIISAQVSVLSMRASASLLKENIQFNQFLDSIRTMQNRFGKSTKIHKILTDTINFARLSTMR